PIWSPPPCTRPSWPAGRRSTASRGRPRSRGRSPARRGAGLRSPSRRWYREGLEDQRGQLVEVPVGGTEEVLGGVGPADVQVQVVLPRVVDAPMDLNPVLGAQGR